MDNSYFSKLKSPPNQQAIKVVNADTKLRLSNNYFHVNSNTNKYRIGTDLITLQQAKQWYDFHCVTGIIGQTTKTTVGFTQLEYDKILNRQSDDPIWITCDLLEDSHSSRHTMEEVFIENSNLLELNGTQYDIQIDFQSAPFHISGVNIGLIGTLFKIKIL